MTLQPISLRKLPTIRIAAALIDDGLGKILLVRKAGTTAFMQAGGKIEGDEAPFATLRRELLEELELFIEASTTTYLGRFVEEAANEPGFVVDAELFHVRISSALRPSAEIEEAVWINISDAPTLVLAPLTRQHVLPLASSL